MLNLKTILLALVMFTTIAAQLPQEAQAEGPLRRWWRNLHGGQGCCLTSSPTTANYPANNPYNLQPGQCMRTCQKTCSRTVVNYVPQTCYRTVYKRVPVTNYRPVTNTDPCTGCTVTCMRPCTSYTYQTQRVPYTTYRPVYRTETYKVPVTTITNDCANGNCGVPSAGCSTCATGSSPQSFAPTAAAAPSSQIYYEPAPQGTTGTTGSSLGNSPADQVPTMANPQSSQRSVIAPLVPNQTQSFNVSLPTRTYPTPAPTYQPPAYSNNGHTASTPIRQRWSYSPMRLASHRNVQPVVPTRKTTTTIPAAAQWVEMN